MDFERMGIKKDLRGIMTEIEERDRKDSTRLNSPLKKADDAIEIDTTHRTISEQVKFIVDKARALV
jgi:cytidylate kinase